MVKVFDKLTEICIVIKPKDLREKSGLDKSSLDISGIEREIGMMSDEDDEAIEEVRARERHRE